MRNELRGGKTVAKVPRAPSGLSQKLASLKQSAVTAVRVRLQHQSGEARWSALCHKLTGLRLHGVSETVNGIAVMIAVSLSGDGKRLRLGRCSKQASTAP